MDKVFKITRFLRITDEQNNLSLTNIALYIGLYKLAFTQGESLNDAALAIGALCNYAFKKHIDKDK